VKTAIRLLLIAVMIAACINSELLSADFDGPAEDGWHSWQTTSADGSELQVYAFTKSGQAVELRVRSNSVCWDNFEIEANDLGVVETDQSIAWLQRLIKPNSDLSSDAIMAISQHAGDLPVEILIGIVRTGTDQALREEALFWLAQSDNDAAFKELDRLLSGTS